MTLKFQMSRVGLDFELNWAGKYAVDGNAFRRPARYDVFVVRDEGLEFFEVSGGFATGDNASDHKAACIFALFQKPIAVT